jgi:hypothetical protein
VFAVLAATAVLLKAFYSGAAQASVDWARDGRVRHALVRSKRIAPLAATSLRTEECAIARARQETGALERRQGTLHHVQVLPGQARDVGGCEPKPRRLLQRFSHASYCGDALLDQPGTLTRQRYVNG